LRTVELRPIWGSDPVRSAYRPPHLKKTAEVYRQWLDLAGKYLPIHTESDMWRFSRRWTEKDAPQGWKIHISATINSANGIFQAIAPFLSDRNALYKGPATLVELARLNSGLCYGYSQVGKFLTIYPRDSDDLSDLVDGLSQRVPLDPESPRVPFDLILHPGSNIFFRFGSFVSQTVSDENGVAVPAIVSPEGELVPDRRDAPFPQWIDAPPLFLDTRSADSVAPSPLLVRYRVFRAISQRGKGGVYEAFDLARNPGFRCVLKEGRLYGETAWDGIDGRGRTLHEERVLRELREIGVAVPAVLDSFDAGGNRYLVLEKVEGPTLESYVARKTRRLRLASAIDLGVRIADLVAKVHHSGWVWRDCKPANILVGDAGHLTLIDFEGACPINRPEFLPWNTPTYAPPEVKSGAPIRVPNSNLPEDLYALGAVLYFLLEGKNYRSAAPANRDAKNLPAGPKVTRRRIPKAITVLISKLLCDDPRKRPPAHEVADALRAIERDSPKKFGKSDIAADRVE